MIPQRCVQCQAPTTPAREEKHIGVSFCPACEVLLVRVSEVDVYGSYLADIPFEFAHLVRRVIVLAQASPDPDSPRYERRRLFRVVA